VRARITLAVLALLAGALMLAGLVSWSLIARANAEAARRSVVRQAGLLARDKAVANEKGVIPLVESFAGIRRASVLEVSATGKLLSAQPRLLVPQGDIDTRRLAQGKTSSGTAGQLAFAAVPLVRIPAGLGTHGDETIVALAIQRRVGGAANSLGYYLLASAISLLVAGAASAAIAHRISRRVLAAARTAKQIAAGDFNARIPESRRAYPELAGLDAAINSMAADLARSRQLERQFFLSISHDLRTPLTSIRGYAEAIHDAAVPDPPAAAGVVIAEARRLERLIGDLLDLARLDAHRFSLSLEPTDLAISAQEAAEALRYEFEAAGVSLEVHVPDHPVVLQLDPDRIRQVVANLVENALKFATSSVRVDVEAAAGMSALLAVEDDGPGIAPEDLPHVFERLYTSNRQVARAAGTGLGLAIVAELTEAMGGTVHVLSPLSSGVGTRFSVVLGHDGHTVDHRHHLDGSRHTFGPGRLSGPAAPKGAAPAP
jgi:two-component system OmpR family sensor kinase